MQMETKNSEPCSTELKLTSVPTDLSHTTGMKATKNPDSYGDIIDTAVSRSRELLLLELFDDALACLDTVGHEEIPAEYAIAIARAKARVWMNRGYTRRARDILQETCSLLNQDTKKLMRSSLLVHLAFVSFVGCADDVDDGVLTENQQLLDMIPLVDHNIDTIEMQCQLDKIAIAMQALNTRDGEDCRPRIHERLHPLAEYCLKTDNFHGLWMTSNALCQAQSGEEAIRWLRRVLGLSLPIELKGRFAIELATRLLFAGQKEEAKDWLTQANSLFEDSGHEFGKLEARRLYLQYQLGDEKDVLRELIEQLEIHIKGDYPVGLLRSAIPVLTMAYDRGDFDTYLRLQEVFNYVCEEAGAKLEEILLSVQLLATLHAGTGHRGTVIKLGRSLYAECTKRRYWTSACLSGQILSLALNTRGANHEALLIAEDLLELSKRERLTIRSDMAYHFGVMRGIKADANRVDTCLMVIDFLMEEAERDIDIEKKKNACSKLEYSAGLQFELARTLVNEQVHWENKSRATMARIKLLSQDLSPVERFTFHGVCDELECSILLSHGKKQGDTLLESQCLEICDRLIDGYTTHGMKFHAAVKYQFRGLIRNQMYQKQSNLQGKIKELVVAEGDFRKAFEMFRGMASWQQALVAHHQLTRTHVEAWDLVGMPREFVMGSLEQLEALADRQRKELVMLGGLTALLQKQQYSMTTEVQDLYRWALGMSVDVAEDLLLWSQKKKARALSEILGLGVKMPMAVEAALPPEVCEELNRLTKAFAGAGPQHQFFLMQRIEEQEKIAMQQPLFKDYVTLRDGIVEGMDDLKKIETGRRVILVDWITWRDSLLLVIADAGGCEVHTLPLTVTMIEEWMKKNFESREAKKDCLTKDEFEPTMRFLDVLIEPLVKYSNPDDLLLLCPTAVISGIPLHTLRAGNMPLILRNPVVYTPNLSVGRICAERRGGIGGASFFGMFDSEKEAVKIYKQMSDLARTMNGDHFCGEKSTKEAYKGRAKTARLIHHHLHGTFEAENVLAQAIELAHGSHLTVEELFELELNAPLVVLIACQSGVQAMANDEPLGLISGFLCAGAASVVAAVWHVPSGAGRIFSEAFYEQLAGKGLVDLALAVQQAILTVRDQPSTSSTYHWGSFCLSGSWWFEGEPA